MTGKVWLVGAGPGDVGLLTVKGRQVLEQAEVVVYDALVSEEILTLIPQTAETIFAGKRSGNHYLKQEETNELLWQEAAKGKRVVRLKGGDPFVFGRGGEELEALIEHNIPFEVVPGITSAFAVPAYNGIPVTHRDYCGSVHVITGHRQEKKDSIDYGALVKAGGTLIFLMGVAALKEISTGLLQGGMEPDTPTAVLEKGTTAKQRRIVGTLSDIEELCERERIGTPAIIVVGEVCGLSERFAWYEKLPLAGVRVLVTRPVQSGSVLSEMLRERGAQVLELPAISIEAVSDDTALCKSLQTLQNGGYDWLVFTSPNGVNIFFQKLLQYADIRALAGVRTAVIGEGSEKALLKYGIKADFKPSVYDGETLGRELASVCKPGGRLLIPRAVIGNPELICELQKKEGLVIEDLPIYDTVYHNSSILDEKELIENGAVDFVTFTSASTVKGFTAVTGDTDYSQLRAVCIGRQTAAEAKKHGMQVWTAERATLESLTECLIRAVEETRQKQ